MITRRVAYNPAAKRLEPIKLELGCWICTARF